MTVAPLAASRETPPNEELQRILALQTAARQRLRGRSVEERLNSLRKLRLAIESHMEAVLDALAQDLGKPRAEAMADFGAPLWELGLIESSLEQWTLPHSVVPQAGAVSGATARIFHEPRGRVLIFGPWNFPFALLMQPLASAIAAGNSVVAKPSEMAPATAAISRKILNEVFPEEEVAVVEGGPDVAAALLTLPFDHVFFTGSTKTGRTVMAAAAAHLSSVTLELGGKCPAIVDEHVDIGMAAQNIVQGKFFNAGQICLAPDHVWVATAQRDALIAEMGRLIDAQFYQDGRLQPDRIARVINNSNIDRLLGLIDDAVLRGATIVRGGCLADGTIEPTILVDVPPDARIMEEEIFGPVLPVMTFDERSQVAEAAMAQGLPLALYIFSDRTTFIDAILAETMSGGVTVNGMMLHASDAGLPFGGVGASGMGAYHGAFGFAELTHRRSVYVQPNVAGAASG